MQSNPVTAWGVYAVWRRHARVYQKTWLINSLPPLSEPLIYLVAFGYGLSPLVGEVTYQTRTVSYLTFLAPGMMAVAVLFQSFFEGAYGSFIRLSFQKTWRALLTSPLTFTEVFLGDLLWATSKGILAGVLTGLLAAAWGLYSLGELVLSLPTMGLGSLLFAAAGLLTAGTVRTVDQINIPVFTFVVPMFTFCGTYFPRETLPAALGQMAAVLPLSALVDLLRWPLGVPGWWELSLGWLLLWTAVLSVLAWRQIYPQLFQ